MQTKILTMRMTTITNVSAGPPPAARITEMANSGLSGRRIAFTTPLTYARRLSRLLELRGAVPVPLPTVVVEPTPSTLAAVRPYLLPGALDSFAAVAFTSRVGISSFALALEDPPPPSPPLSSSRSQSLVLAALGKDAELLREGDLVSKLCRNPSKIEILVPKIATPAELVNSLGDGFGRTVLCPVPTMVDLQEPPVIPEFLNQLTAVGWVVVSVSAYETRWAGPYCIAQMVRIAEGDDRLDAMVFTSSAEVEGLVRGLEAAGRDWGAVRRRWPRMVVAAHGPVTAGGAERFGIGVDVVGARFDSFDGVLDALELKFRDQIKHL